MYNRETILKHLNEGNYYVDKHSLSLFLNDWKLDSIYEDETGLEFYDDLTLDKIKRGISLKAQGFTDEQIIVKLQKMEARIEKNENSECVEPVIVKDYVQVSDDSSENNEEEHIITDLTPKPEKSFTLDVTSQTLQMLAEAVAKKISDDITNSDMAVKLIEAGGYKKDNEILAQQVKDLLQHNKELTERLEQLESHSSKTFWQRIWGK